MKLRLVVIGMILVASAVALAQDDTPPAASSEEMASPAVDLAEPDGRMAAPTGPVPVPEPTEKAVSYYRSGNVLWVVSTLWGVAVPALLLFSGLSARMRTWAERLGRKWFFVLGLYFLLFSLVTFVLDLPLAYYSEFARQHAYGLSNQTLGKWIGDSLKGLGVGTIFGVLILWIPYLLLKKSPRRWWLYTGLTAVPVLFFVTLISPIWVDPLFNDFMPMKDESLRDEILALAERSGIEGTRVFEVEKSVDTEAVNAYVSGFLDTKRIVLWDTIIAKLQRDELLFVMSHEMGHYVLGHIYMGVFFLSGLILLGLYLIHRTSGALIARFRDRFGFSELGDVASLPLLLLLFSVFFLAVAPFALAFGRHIEHESDRFGLELTQQNHAAAMAFVRLGEENLAYPRPGLLFKLWRSTHPPLGERIDFCNEYRPWESGDELEYGSHFRSGSP